MGHAFFGEQGPLVLSLFDGFFQGGSRMVHIEAVRNLQFTTAQRHSVLALASSVYREYTMQYYRDTVMYERLHSARVPTLALDRDHNDMWHSVDRTIVDQMVRGSDVVLSLKEQPLTALAAHGTHDKPLLVSLHRSDPENQGEGTEELLSLAQNGLLSKAICCAEATREAYARCGIPESLLTVVPNGVDLNRFHRDPLARTQTRDLLQIPLSAPVIVIAARFAPMKNIELFMQAAALYLQHEPTAHFILCGAGLTPDNRDLVNLMTPLPQAQQHRIHALGIQHHMAGFYNAADIVSLTSSFGEAAPLCLLEGMACGAIPVTTPVGDSALMVKDPRLVTGFTPEAVAQAWIDAFDNRQEHRSRISARRQRLSDQRVFDAYARLINEALA